MHDSRRRSAQARHGAGPWLRACVALAVLALAAAAQEPAPEVAGPTLERVERARVEALAAEAEAGVEEGGPDAEFAGQLVALYDEALAFLDAARASRERALEFERRRLEAPAEIEQLQQELAKEPAPVELPEELPTDLGQLHAALAQAGADLAAARSRVSELQLRADARAQRRAELPGELTEAEGRVETLLEKLDTPPVEGAAPRLVEARRLRRAAELQAAEFRLVALQQERDAAVLGDTLLDLERQRAVRKRSRAEELEQLWREVVNDAERAEAEAALRAARQAAAVANHPAVKAVAEETRRLAERRTGPQGLRTRIERAARELEELRRDLDELEADKRSVEAKKEAAGLSPEIGVLLVTQRSQLTSPSDYRARIARRSIADARIDIERIDLEEEQRRHFDVAAIVEERLAEQPPPPDEAEAVEDALRAALLAQIKAREDLLKDLREYTAQLQQLNAVERALADKAEAFAAFIDEHVLWVRIADPIYTDTGTLLANTRDAAAWLLDAEGWAAIAGWTVDALPARIADLVLKALLLVILFSVRPGLRRRIADDAYLVARLRTDQFAYTIRTVLATLLLALPMPLLLFVASNLLAGVGSLGVVTEGSSLGLLRAAASGLEAVALVLLVANLVWVGCRPRGLAEAHFRWPAASLKLLRRHLKWLVALGLPVVFVVAAMGSEGTPNEYASSLGRLAFMVGQAALLVFAVSVLRPEKGVLGPTIERHPHGWLARLGRVLFPLSVLVPGVFFVMSALGYLYTAKQLQDRIEATVYLILALVAAHALLMRWLFVARRRLALAQYRKRRAAQLEKAEQAEKAEKAGKAGKAKGEGPSLSEELVEDEVDIPSLSEQSETLVETLVGVALVLGMGLVWADVLPALGFLDAFELWEHTVETERALPQPDGGSTFEVVKELVPVTLADLLVALVALTLTTIAARNLPGLLEIMVLQRLPMQRAGRYAVTTISRYVIVVIGLALMFNAVGIGWSTVQWLAAAVGVGLGFGLQEIFANFVSGLIILFERPIRVGDTVTVGQTTGTVNKVHMRATTIITWDRTELIVPNKEFITNQLVNWTLSDSVLRVIVKVGIAYGSDTRKAEELLYRVAEEQPEIVDDPAPRVVFTEFGDSTLNFELRCFVADPDLWRTIHHQLNNAIDRLFREHGVVIAFPQRDLHLRTTDAPLRVVREEDTVEPDDIVPRPSRDE